MADKRIQIQTFTPAGGMNQDDSIITPSVDSEAGRSLFESGDYRYALNGKIGSSRNDSFGDFENIKGTVEVTDYYVRGNIMTNNEFNDDLNDWSVVAQDRSWTVVTGIAVVTISGSSGTYDSDILYQTKTFLTKTVKVKYSVRGSLGFTGNTFYINIVFLSGSTVINTTTKLYNEGDPYKDDGFVLIVPEGATGIGFYATGTKSGPTVQVSVKNFDTISWTAGFVPMGTEKVIGKYEDNEFQKLYYFVYNNSGNHCIRYWDPITNKIYELLKWSGLKFESTYFVKAAKLDNWMAFTDRNNRPRLIDVDTITDLFLELDTDFREYHISYHKWSPTNPPIIKTFYSSGVYNFKNKGLFQFSYRYIYYGNLRSRWSPISVAQPMEEVTDTSLLQYNIRVFIPGVILDDPEIDAEWNYFGHDDIKFLKAVEYIEIGFRRSQVDVWKLWKRIKTSELSSTLYYDFYNTEVENIIPTEDFYQPFDTVPFKAGIIEAIDNRFVFGDCLDEQDLADPVVISDVAVKKAPDISNSWTKDGGYTALSSADQTEYVSRNAQKSFTFKARALYKPCIQFFDRSGWRSLGYTNSSWFYSLDAIPASSFTFSSQKYTEPQTGLEFYFPASFKPPLWAVGYQIMRSNALNIDFFIIATANAPDYLIDQTSDLRDIQSAPDAIKNSIQQYFENRDLVTATEFNDAVKTGEIKAKAIQITEIPITNITDIPNKNFLKKKPTNTILHQVMIQRRLTQISTSIANASRLYIDINNWVNAAKSNSDGSHNHPMNNVFYDFRRGDRLRFVGADVSNPTNSQKKIYDVVILEYTGKALIVAKPSSLQWLPPKNVSTSSFEDYFIEVYRPKDEVDSDFIFYESGEWYPVLHPGTDNRDWSKRDWRWGGITQVTANTYGSGASAYKVFHKVPFFFGDCHLKSTAIFSNFPVISTQARFITMNPFTFGNENILEKTLDEDDRTLAWEKNNGRGALAYTVLPEVKFKTTQCRFSGKIVEQSLVNNINRVRSEDQKIFPSEYGRIRGLINIGNGQIESVGSILLAIGEREAWSIYVNRTTLEDLSGRTQVSLSNQVLGSFNKLLGSHGTLNPESVSFKRDRVYWWDAINGTWVRYGRDGLTPISQYKMRNWFRELGNLLIGKYTSSEIPVAISGYDAFHEELVTFQNHSSLPATFRGYDTYKGAVFSEENTRWKPMHNYEPELFGKMNNTMVAFVGGGLWILEQTDEYNTFFGTKYDSKIEPVFNQFAADVKSWQTVAVVSSDKWSIERIQSEYRGQKTIQESNIPLSEMQDREDTYYAAILNDENSLSVTNPLIDGNKMRSKAIKVLLKLDPSVVTRSLLHYAMAGFINSPKNP